MQVRYQAAPHTDKPQIIACHLPFEGPLDVLVMLSRGDLEAHAP